MMKQTIIVKKHCDICDKVIPNQFKHFCCIMCNKKHLCQEHRIKLIRIHKTRKYRYSTDTEGYLCIECFKLLKSK